MTDPPVTLPDDWEPTPTINDIYDLAPDDPNRCQANQGEFDGARTPRLRCNRPDGHNATQTVWWPEGDPPPRKP